MVARDKILVDATVCYDAVVVKDDNDEKALAEVRWNETLVEKSSGERMPAWKWQLWVDTRGEVEVRTLDSSVEGWVWPRRARPVRAVTGPKRWLGKRVEQTNSFPGFGAYVGRKGTVSEAFTDEKGNEHCCVDGLWCPALFLTELQEEES